MKQILLMIAVVALVGCSGLPEGYSYSKELRQAYRKYGKWVRVEPVYRTYSNIRFVDYRNFYFKTKDGKNVIIRESGDGGIYNPYKRNY